MLSALSSWHGLKEQRCMVWSELTGQPSWEKRFQLYARSAESKVLAGTERMRSMIIDGSQAVVSSPPAATIGSGSGSEGCGTQGQQGVGTGSGRDDLVVGVGVHAEADIGDEPLLLQQPQPGDEAVA